MTAARSAATDSPANERLEARARRVLELSRRDQQAFVRALLRPAAPNRRLRKAWRKHASRTGPDAPGAWPETSPARTHRSRG